MRFAKLAALMAVLAACGRVGLIFSFESDASGNPDIYLATRTCP